MIGEAREFAFRHNRLCYGKFPVLAARRQLRRQKDAPWRASHPRHPLPRPFICNDQSTWVRHDRGVSGRGVRWGACRHQDGLGPFPQGRGRSLL